MFIELLFFIIKIIDNRTRSIDKLSVLSTAEKLVSRQYRELVISMSWQCRLADNFNE